jgi:hypothetical protein
LRHYIAACDVAACDVANYATCDVVRRDVDPVMGTDGFLRAPLFTNPSNLSGQPGILPTQINFACAGGRAQQPPQGPSSALKDRS